VWRALTEQDLAASAVSTLLLALRGYGLRAMRSRARTLSERLERFGFTRLDEAAGRELVFGLAGRFWKPSGGLRRDLDRDTFLTFAEEGCVKAAWNLVVGGERDGGCELSTETRVQCFGASAHRSFHVYWTLIRPFSGAIRRSLLRSVKRAAERV
jgi:hypothetical protein